MPLALYNPAGWPEQPDPWERRQGESPPAWAAFQVYRDMRVGERSARQVAKMIGKSYTLISRWCATHDWVARTAAWDAEQDRVALRARKDEIERINRQDIALADKMLEAADRAIPAAERVLAGQPHALQEWVKTATKVRRDAAGIAEPDKRAVVAGDPDSSAQHDIEADAVIANMDPAQMLQFREFSLEFAEAKARRAAGV